MRSVAALGVVRERSKEGESIGRCDWQVGEGFFSLPVSRSSLFLILYTLAGGVCGAVRDIEIRGSCAPAAPPVTFVAERRDKWTRSDVIHN